MAYYVFSLSDAIFDLVIRLSGQELARMMVTLAPAVPLALVVLFWARDRTLGWIACLVVVGDGAAAVRAQRRRRAAATTRAT